MKKKTLILMLGFLLIGVNLYAAGDLIVEGKAGIGTTTPGATLDVRGSAIFNEDGADADFRIEGDTDANLLRTDASADQVLIGVSSTTATGHKMLVKNGNPSRQPTSGNAAVSGATQVTDATTLGMGGQYFGERSPASNITVTAQTWGLRGTTMAEEYGTIRGDMIGVFGDAHDYNYGGTVSKLIGVAGQNNTEAVNGNTEIIDAINIQGRGTKVWAMGGVATVTNAYNFYGIAHGGDGTITNAYGMYLQKQTKGNNNYGIVLDGDGAGADVVFGPSKNVRIYSSSGELYAKDGAGNVTQISPHDPETGEWIYYSKNLKTGKVKQVNMEKLVKLLEKLTGEKLMIETIEETK